MVKRKETVEEINMLRLQAKYEQARCDAGYLGIPGLLLGMGCIDYIVERTIHEGEEVKVEDKEEDEEERSLIGMGQRRNRLRTLIRDARRHLD